MTDPGVERRPDSFQSLIPTATPFVLPLVVFLLITSWYPDFAGSYETDTLEGSVIGVTSKTWTYLALIGTQVLVATGLLIYFRKVYLQQFPLRCSPLAVVVGIVGFALWIGLCYLQIEPQLLAMVGFDMDRPSFNPWTIPDSGVRAVFLGLRFTVLVLIVPVVEELFVRGWLVRWAQSPDWEELTLKNLSLKALLAASIYGVIAHPMEAIAAFLWFGLVTWLMNRTGNLWDCVVAHMTTNLLLGIYVLIFSQWQLW